MARHDRERILDMLEAVGKIRIRVERGRERFDTDEDLQIVMAHLVQMIGEAAARMSPEFTEAHPAVPWRALAGMRNRVVHEYFSLDLDVLWATVANDVPQLAEQLRLIAEKVRDSTDSASD